eukprot:gene30435-52568_t
MFGASRMFGLIEAGAAVTLDLSVQFIGAGIIGEPLDAEVELLKETGRLLFMRGIVTQGDERPVMDKVENRYNALVSAKELKPDADQLKAVRALARVQADLEAVPPRGSTIWRFLRKKPDPARGLYLWGGVGRGKSMLMDLFFEAVQIRRKKRVHFHEFMQDIHARLRVERDKMQGDPIPPV